MKNIGYSTQANVVDLHKKRLTLYSWNNLKIDCLIEYVIYGDLFAFFLICLQIKACELGRSQRADFLIELYRYIFKHSGYIYMTH